MGNNLIIGQLLALLTAACWAQNSIIYRYLGTRVGSDAAAHVRMWIALPAMAMLAFFVEGSAFPTSLSAQTYGLLFVSGAIGFFLTDLFLFQAYVLLGNRETMVIMTLSPIVTAIFSNFLFAESLNPRQILGISVTILGIILMVVMGSRLKISDEEQKTRLKGFLFAMLASVLQSVSYLFARYALNETGPISSNLLRTVGGLVAFILYNVVYKRNAKKQFQSFKNKKFFALLAIAAIVGPVIGMSSQMKAFTLAPIGIVTTLTQVTPILLIPFDIFIMHKRLSLSDMAGTLLSIVGVALLFLAA